MVRKNVPEVIPALLSVIPLTSIYCLLFYKGGSELFQGIWVLCIPLISMLAGLKIATIICAVEFIFISAVCFIPSFGHEYPLDVSTRYLAAFFTNFILAFSYAYSKDLLHYEYIKELKKLGQIDALTGLLNRRGFSLYCETLWKQAIRDKAAISFLMIDIDSFKKYNDAYGHQKGDLCLIKCVKIFKETAKRPLDLLVRLGGEEFGVLLFGADMDEAVSIAEKIRAKVEKETVDISGNQSKNISLSIGVASTSNLTKGKYRNFDDMLVVANTNTYIAKKKGGNQVWYSIEEITQNS
jgi:diguanylate cyclase (GGDEF)-like protein